MASEGRKRVRNVDLQRVDLLIDKNKQQLVFHLGQAAFGTTAPLAAACLAVPGFVEWITGGLGGPKGWQHAQKLVMC